jgi:hypothetical protein
VRWRRSHPRRSALALMAGFAAVGGLVNGASVPEGMEQYRLTFYHWAFALAFFVTLVLGLAVADGVGRLVAHPPPWAGTASVGVALAAIVAPAAVNPALDRPTNTLVAAYGPVERQVLDRLARDVLADVDTGAVTLVYGRDDVPFIPLREALALELIDRGFAVRFPPPLRGFVDEERLADPGEADQALVLQVDDATPEPPPGGRLVAEADLTDGFDWDAYDALASRSPDPIPLGDNPTARAQLDALRQSDPALVRRVLDTMPDVGDGAEPLRLRVYLLDPAQLTSVLPTGELS